MIIDTRGDRDVLDYLNRLPDRLYDEAKKRFQKRAMAAHKEVQGNLRGDPITSRTGALARSIRYSVTGEKLSTLEGHLYSASEIGGKDLVYAPIHEYGGTIKAKNAYRGVPGGPYLNVPTANNKTAAGVTRMPAAGVFVFGGHIQKLRSGRYGVVLNGKLMFVLIKQVKIEPGLGMRDAMFGQVPSLLADLAGLDI